MEKTGSNTDSLKVQIKNILEFFKSKTTRLNALELLLGLTENNEVLPILKDTDTCRLIIRQLETRDMNSEETLTSLHILINLSAKEDYIKHFLELNTTVRLAKLFLSKTDQEIKVTPLADDNLFCLDLDLGLGGDLSLGGSSQENQLPNVNKVLENYVLDNSKTKNIEKEQLTTLPYILMILTNLTTTEEGQKQLFCSDKKELEKVKGLVFLKMIEKLFENIYKEELDFCSSVVANISALKEGRVFMLEYKIFETILSQFDKMNNFKMVNMLRIFRNCCFEFEQYEESLTSREGLMMVYAFKVLIETNLQKDSGKLNCLALDSIRFTHFDHIKAQEEKEIVNDLIVDVFVVLTNTTTAFPLVVKKGLKEVWEIVKKKIKGHQIEDRLFVISNFLQMH